MFNNEEMIRDFFSGELSASLANTDYIVAMLNTKAADLASQKSALPWKKAATNAKLELLTEILQDIKLVLSPAASEELH